MRHTAKVGDITRDITSVFTSTNPADNFTGVTSVRFSMWKPGSSVNKVDRAIGAAVVSGDGATLTLSYTPTAPDMDTPGYYQVMWEVTRGGKTGAYPSEGYDIVIIE